MLTTTLTSLQAHYACAEGIETLIQSLPLSHTDDAPIALAHILDSNGLDHAIWALRTQDPTYAARFADSCVKEIPRLPAKVTATPHYADCVAYAAHYAEEAASAAKAAAKDAAKAATKAYAAARAARTAPLYADYATAPRYAEEAAAAYDAAREKQKQIFLDLVK